MPAERGLAWWRYCVEQAQLKESFARGSEPALVLVKPNDRSEAFRLLAWQPSDAVWLLPECDLVRVLKRTRRFGLLPAFEVIVVAWSVVEPLLAELTQPVQSGLRIIEGASVKEAERRLSSLSGRPMGAYTPVRPDHCIELEAAA